MKLWRCTLLASSLFIETAHFFVAGPIPASLGGLEALQILALEDNELSGGLSDLFIYRYRFSIEAACAVFKSRVHEAVRAEFRLLALSSTLTSQRLSRKPDCL